MADVEPIWWLRIFMAALLIAMCIFAWCEISKAMAVKRYYAHRREAFDSQIAAAMLVAAFVKESEAADAAKTNESKPEE